MSYRDTLGRLFTPGVIANIPTGRLVWVDAVHGNDDLAVRERMTVPFKTLAKAKEKAVSGDTIMVLPGTYGDKDLLKSGVDYYFLPGAKVFYDGNEDGGIFDTGIYGTNGEVESVIGGYGEFEVSNSVSTGYAINSAASGSNLIIHAKRIFSVQKAVVVTAASGSLKIEAFDEIGAGEDVIQLNTSNLEGTVIVRAHRLFTSGGACVKVDGGSVEVIAHRLYASADSAVRVDGGSGVVMVEAHEIKAENDPAVYYASGYGAHLTLKRAKIISLYDSGYGVAIQISAIASSASKKVRVSNCLLLPHSTATYSIIASHTGTIVQFHGYSVSTKGVHAYITPIGGSVLTNTDIS